MIVVGLTGYSRVGKDSVANVLVEKHGFERLTFAAALKDILRSVDPILGVHVDEDGETETVSLSHLSLHSEDEIKASRYGKEYIRLLQKLGTEGVRKYDDSFWVDLIVKQLRQGAGTNKRYVVTDARFPNEVRALRENLRSGDSVEVWQVKRPGTVPVGRELHASEKHVGNMGEDFAIYNDGTLAQLSTTVTESVTMLLADANYRKGPLDPK